MKIFQIENDLVLNEFKEKDNYIIEETEYGDPKKCAIYFSSNDIYYPNNKERFRIRIIEKNFFEWYGTRISSCKKHIFVRDIFKQWYLGGINEQLNSPQKILEWLQKETDGYKIITVGSSAGGYAATLFGSLLRAEKVFSFNGYFDLMPEVEIKDSAVINPILFRNVTNPELAPYYNLEKFMHTETPVYYFNSLESFVDKIQKNRLGQNKNVIIIAFRTSLHGIPFLKCCLPFIFCYKKNELIKFSIKSHNPIIFSIKQAGLCASILCFIKQLYATYKKRH